MNKVAIGAVALIIIAGGIYWYTTQKTPQGGGGAAVTQNREELNQLASTISWDFKDAGVEKDEIVEIPKTSVSVTISGKTYDAGTYSGSCSSIRESSWEILPNEVDGAICWFAGGGSEIGVFKEETGLVIKVGLIEEGSEEQAGLRGNFKTLFTVE